MSEEQPATPSVITIGVFDGVHLGHQALAAAAVEQAQHLKVRSRAVTFDPHPRAVLSQHHAPAQLTTIAFRTQLLQQAGIDEVTVLSFTPELAQMEPEQFVTQILVQQHGATHIVVGEQFRFGHRARGDVALLQRMGSELGFGVTAVAPVLTQDAATGNTACSSTLIRELLTQGDVSAAAVLLTRAHRLEGMVVAGQARGRELGFPTANVSVASGAAIPQDGVYAGYLVRNLSQPLERQQRLPAAISIGTNLTFDAKTRTVEAFVIDTPHWLELYDEYVGVELVQRVRPMLRFESVPELVEAMHRDVAQVRTLVGQGVG